jgi:hypothetical protein
MLMRRLFVGIASGALIGAAAVYAQSLPTTQPGINTPGFVQMCASGSGAYVPCDSPGALPQSVRIVQPTSLPTTPSVQYPLGAIPITASATGTTAATTATLAALVGHTTYLCGFSIRANATGAVTGTATVTGVITGTMSFVQWTAPLASGIGIIEPNLGPLCISASGTNQAIAVVSAAPGSGGTVSVSAWGYQQ